MVKLLAAYCHDAECEIQRILTGGKITIDQEKKHVKV